MKIKYIKISNILSFEHKNSLDDLEGIHFNSYLNILIGPNGAGKSNFLEIINYIFRNVLYLGCSYNEAIIEEYNRDYSKHPLYGALTLQQRQPGALRKNKFSDSDLQQIELNIELNEADLENLMFVQNNIQEINRLFGTYASTNVRPNFGYGINRSDLESLNNVTFIFIRSNDKELFSVKTKTSHRFSDFILTFLQYFHFIQCIILIANKYESKDWLPLKKTFALISGYRNYNKIDPKYAVTRDKNSNLQEIIKKSGAESMRLSGNDEPIVFNLVKHKLSYKLSDIEYDYLQEKSDYRFDISSTKKLSEDFVLKNINELLDMTLELTITLKKEKHTTEYVFSFLDKRQQPVDVLDLSAGEKGILHFIFSLYGYDLMKGLMIIDEPELHIHPQMQKKYLTIFDKVKNQLGLQFIIATHSPIFVNHKTIGNVYRFYKHNNKFTEIVRPNIDEHDSDLVRILTYTNSSKIFFSNKVILVEGLFDEYFYRFFSDHYAKDPTKNSLDIEIMSIESKHNYRLWKEFLTKYKILVYYIGDLDNVFKEEFSIIDSNTKEKLKKEFERTDETVAKSIAADPNYRTYKKYTKELLNFIKNVKKNEWDNIQTQIRNNYNNRICILRQGELEDYLELTAKKLEKIIDFCNNKFHLWYNKKNAKSEEIDNIFEQISN